MASSLGLYPFWRPLNKSDDDNDDDEAYAMTVERENSVRRPLFCMSQGYRPSSSSCRP